MRGKSPDRENGIIAVIPAEERSEEEPESSDEGSGTEEEDEDGAGTTSSRETAQPALKQRLEPV